MRALERDAMVCLPILMTAPEKGCPNAKGRSCVIHRAFGAIASYPVPPLRSNCLVAWRLGLSNWAESR